MTASRIGVFSDCTKFSSPTRSSKGTTAQSVAEEALSSSSSQIAQSLSPSRKRSISWSSQGDSQLSPLLDFFDDEIDQSEKSEDSLPTCEPLASDEDSQAAMAFPNNTRKRRREENPLPVDEISMTINEVLQRSFDPHCRAAMRDLIVCKGFLDFLIEELSEEEFFWQKNLFLILRKEKIFCEQDVNSSVSLKEGTEKITKQIIQIARGLSQEKIGRLQSQIVPEYASAANLLKLSALYRQIDDLIPSSRDIRIKDKLYKFPEQFADLGFVDEAIALVSEFSRRFKDRNSEATMLSKVAKIFAKKGKMTEAIKAANAIKISSVKEDFFSCLHYREKNSLEGSRRLY